MRTRPATVWWRCTVDGCGDDVELTVPVATRLEVRGGRQMLVCEAIPNAQPIYDHALAKHGPPDWEVPEDDP